MNLTQTEKDSPLWKKIKEHLLNRITRLRESNDGFLDEYETARVRGRIAEAKELINIESAAIAPDEY